MLSVPPIGPDGYAYTCTVFPVSPFQYAAVIDGRSLRSSGVEECNGKVVGVCKSSGNNPNKRQFYGL